MILPGLGEMAIPEPLTVARGTNTPIGRVLPGVRGVSAHTDRVSKGRFLQRDKGGIDMLDRRKHLPTTLHAFTQILPEHCFAGLLASVAGAGWGNWEITFSL